MALIAVAYLLARHQGRRFHVRPWWPRWCWRLVNTLIRPLLVLLTLPITVLTLGFFILLSSTAFLFWFVGSDAQGLSWWKAYWVAARSVRCCTAFFPGPCPPCCHRSKVREERAKSA